MAVSKTEIIKDEAERKIVKHLSLKIRLMDEEEERQRIAQWEKMIKCQRRRRRRERTVAETMSREVMQGPTIK